METGPGELGPFNSFPSSRFVNKDLYPQAPFAFTAGVGTLWMHWYNTVPPTLAIPGSCILPHLYIPLSSVAITPKSQYTGLQQRSSILFMSIYVRHTTLSQAIYYHGFCTRKLLPGGARQEPFLLLQCHLDPVGDLLLYTHTHTHNSPQLLCGCEEHMKNNNM